MSQWNEASFTSKIELSISCRNLIDADVFSKSDPQCVVYLKDSYKADYYEIGRTEVIYDNLNPDFVRKIQVGYNFETVQRLKFEVWDIDYNGRDFLGHMETTLPDIIAAKGEQFVQSLTGVPNKNCGTVHIVVEEVNACNDVLHVQFRGRSLKKVCWFWKPSPFLSVWRSNEGGSFTVVYRSEHRSYTQHPTWNPIKLSLKDLCNGDYDRNLKIDCLSYSSRGNHKLIGTFHSNLNELLSSDHERIFQLSDRTHEGSRGSIEVASIELEKRFSFFEYIRGGTELHFVVAIDFTASNGDPKNTDSLHHIDTLSGKPNSYEIALRAVGEIIEHYGNKDYFAGFGFGAKFPPSDAVSHEFPLNGNPAHPYCKGIDELLIHYRNMITTVSLHGPTNFAPVVTSTAKIASQYETGKNYFVLLIITDGIICDMYQTKKAIIAASKLPISIIIVGVGNADFSAMDELDSDDALLTVDNMTAQRDIVQFVPMNRFLNPNNSSITSKVELAKEVLYEIPEQLVSYMSSRGFKPGD